jgi:hypothetical protein
MCHMTSSVSILQYLLNNWSQLIACHPQVCHFENMWTQKPLKCCRRFKWQSVHESLKITLQSNRDAYCGISSTVFSAKFFKISISRLSVDFFQVTRHISARQRRRRQLKAMVRPDSFIVTMSRRNRYMSASKAANVLNLSSGVRICVMECQSRRSKTFWCGTYKIAKLTMCKT